MMNIVHQMFSELCIEVVFELSVEHVMCSELSVVCVKKNINNYVVTHFRNKAEDRD